MHQCLPLPFLLGRATRLDRRCDADNCTTQQSNLCQIENNKNDSDADADENNDNPALTSPIIHFTLKSECGMAELPEMSWMLSIFLF
jgi:hypothetical protein